MERIKLLKIACIALGIGLLAMVALAAFIIGHERLSLIVYGKPLYKDKQKAIMTVMAAVGIGLILSSSQL